jgi:Mn2+/Fe2+ NRAMP family transporter
VQADNRKVEDQRPPPLTFWGRFRYLGPGLIITGSIVGSGELIMTTKLGAEAGFVMIWLILLGCLVKVFVQIELGRYAISSAETTLKAMDRVPGPRLVTSWLLWIWLVMFVAVLFQTSGIAGSVAEIFTVSLPASEAEAANREPAGGSALELWVVIVVLSVIALLVRGRYRLVECVSMAMVFLFTLGTIAAAVMLQWTPSAIRPESLLEGVLFSFSREDGTPIDFTTAFAAFGITGVGATELIYYPYWCLEKGYARLAGPRVESAEWETRARGWLRVMQVDAWLSLVIYTIATVAFYLLGAAVLHGQQIPVENVDLIKNLSTPYRVTFGDLGFYAFLVGAFCVLYSTFFVATASNARLCANAVELFGVFRYRSPSQFTTAVRIACVILPIFAGTVFIVVGEPVSLVLVGGVAQACMLPLLAGAALYLRHFQTDARIAPGLVWTFFLWLSFLSMLAIGMYQLLDKLGVL